MLGALTFGGLTLFALNERRWRSAFYCIERPGELWGGEAGPLPAGFTPGCSPSNSLRADVRRGAVRAEQYTAPGWRPRALEAALLGAGFALLDEEFVSPNLYEAFFRRGGKKLYYLASRQNGYTAFTLNGAP